MTLTAGQLNRATLARQLLLRRERLDVVDAVHRVVALQAQSPASPYVALWNRLAGFDPAELDAAFARHEVLRATLIRITLHAVHAGDYPVFHRAMVRRLRAARLDDGRFAVGTLSLAEVDALLPELLDFAARPCTTDEIESMLERRLGGDQPRLWRALRTFAPLVHVPTGGPWAFAARSMVAAPEPLPPERFDESVQHLVRRYLEGFGPASIPDIGTFTFLQRPVVKAALRGLGDAVTELPGPDRTPLYDLAGVPVPDEDTPAPPRLMAMRDSAQLAYFDRSRVTPREYRQVIYRRNGDVLPALLVDGYVAGVWRAVDGGIEATAFHPLPNEAWSGLAAEAAGLTEFLARRDPDPYRRYAHWWAKLPAGEVRLLPG
jgi:hypothetical protein